MARVECLLPPRGERRDGGGIYTVLADVWSYGQSVGAAKPHPEAIASEGQRLKARLRQAHQCLAETSQHFYTPGVQLVSAALLRCQGRDEEAEARLWDAIRISRAQESRSWELRAASELARLWRDQGRCAQARNLVAPVYGWFTEGFNLPDLKDAIALLDTL